MATVTSLTQAKIEELMAGWEGVALTQDQINALVSQLWTDVESHDARLTDFNEVVLPKLQEDLAAGSIRVSDLNDNVLPDLELRLDQHDLNLQNLNTVDIPSLNERLTSNSDWILEFNDTTVPALQAQLDINTGAIDTLNTTTLPGLNDRLAVVEGSVGFDPTSLQQQIDTNTGAINTLNTTTLPVLNDRLVAVEEGGGFDSTALEGRLGTLEGKFPIEAGDIAADTITANELAADSVTANEIAAHTITALEIAADTITANEIASHTITALEILGDTITANEIATDTITANEIAGKTITAAEIATDTITANEIAADAITANEIASHTITALEIAADTITANEIATDAITANEIAGKTITAAEIATGTITALEILGHTITANEIAADTITANEIATGTITALEIKGNTITANEIATDAITADEIAGNTITAAEIKGKTITAAEIAGNTITAAEIKGNTITANEILGHTITANEIDTDFISSQKILASQIISGTVSAELLVGGTLEARGYSTAGAWTGQSVGLSASEGFYSYGPTPANGKLEERDTYISFPVDGKPNIISGQLTASTMLVTGGATFRSSSAIEAGAKLVLNGDLKAPKNPPVLSAAYAQIRLTQPASLPKTNSGIYSGLTQGSVSGKAGNRWVAGTSVDSKISNVRHWALDGTDAVDVPLSWSDGLDRFIMGVVWVPSVNRYLVLAETNFTGPPRLGLFDSAFNRIADFEIASGRYNAAYPVALGWDWTNGLALVSYWTTSGVRVDQYTVSATAVAYNNVNVLLSGTAGTIFSKHYAAVFRGSFDFGADKYVAKFLKRTNDSDNPLNSFYVYGPTGLNDSIRNWVNPSSPQPQGVWWDTAAGLFHQLDGINTTITTYEKGETAAASGGNTKFWVGYSWYDSVGTAHETPLSPLASLEMDNYRRAKVVATVDVVPTGIGVDDPNSVRIYVGKTTSAAAAPTTAQLLYRLQLPAGTQTGTVSGLADGAAFSTAKAVDFPAGVAGRIESNNGGSYWAGDNTAKFFQLILESTTDVDAAAGNKPALRIGNIASQHLRIDGNEIQSMVDDANPGDIMLNNGGGAVKIGGSYLRKWNWGFANPGTTDVNGEIKINHGMGISPDVAFGMISGTGTAYKLQLSGRTTSQIIFKATNASTNALAASGVNIGIYWLAMAG